jgi:mycothiol system anti-sigma-R factor
MSCGTPHETDCVEVIEKVYLYLDGEGLDDEVRRDIRVHLDECAPCLRQFGIEQEVKALVARCCGSEQAPAGLRERLLVRLQQVRVEIGSLEYRAD